MWWRIFCDYIATNGTNERTKQKINDPFSSLFKFSLFYSTLTFDYRYFKFFSYKKWSIKISRCEKLWQNWRFKMTISEWEQNGLYPELRQFDKNILKYEIDKNRKKKDLKWLIDLQQKKMNKIRQILASFRWKTQNWNDLTIWFCLLI